MTDLYLTLTRKQAQCSMDAWYSMEGNYPADCKTHVGHAARLEWIFDKSFQELNLKYGRDFTATFHDDYQTNKWAVTLHFVDANQARFFSILGYYNPGFDPFDKLW